jgi:Mg-chelatase subunit ChlD
MKRIIYEVPRWSLYLHRDARGLPSALPEDAGLAQLGDELFERLYSGGGEQLPEDQQDPCHRAWASGIHTTCEALPSFQRLSFEVRGDAFAAGIAVEQLLEELGPHMPKPEGPPLPAPALRRLVGKGSEKASAAIEEARETVEALGGIRWGTGSSTATTTTSPEARNLAARLKNDARLKRIAQLAGRFKRIALAKLRSKTKRGADEITDIEQGADLGRLLPSELGKLMHPVQRLAFLRDLTERRCLQYQLQGSETLGKGPLVVCLDKSGSMDGARDIWATAVALALMEVAKKERRSFALVCFDDDVKYQVLVHPNDKLPEAGLFVGCGGGTDIAEVVCKGLDIIREHPGALRKADIVLITDGGSSTEHASSLRAEAKVMEVTLLGIGVGVARDLLVPWCDEVQLVHDMESVSEEIAGKLFTV